MLNTNFSSLIGSMLGKTNRNLIGLNGDLIQTYSFPVGWLTTANRVAYYKDFSGDVNISGCASLLLGQDDTPATINDYTLGNFVTDYDDVLQAIDFREKENNKQVLSISRTVRNSTVKDIIIREMGLFGVWSFNGNHPIMIAREVLPTPVVIEPYKSYTFTMNIEL